MNRGGFVALAAHVHVRSAGGVEPGDEAGRAAPRLTLCVALTSGLRCSAGHDSTATRTTRGRAGSRHARGDPAPHMTPDTAARPPARTHVAGGIPRLAL
jgi:hypothetical protein